MTEENPEASRVPDIKEALAALEIVQDALDYDAHPKALAASHRVEDCLTSLAQERDDRLAVEAWLDADDDRYQSNGRQYVRGYYLTLYPDQMRDARDRSPRIGGRGRVMAKMTPEGRTVARKAKAAFKRIYPKCVDGYIRLAFIIGWTEAHAAMEKTKAKEPT